MGQDLSAGSTGGGRAKRCSFLSVPLGNDLDRACLVQDSLTKRTATLYRGKSHTGAEALHLAMVMVGALPECVQSAAVRSGDRVKVWDT